jgi:hypothetical protein
MKSSRYARWALLSLLGVAISGFVGRSNGHAAHLGIELIEPPQVQVGSFFNGKDINIRAIFPCECDLALRILGPREDLELMEKGRVGPLWMNVEEVTFTRVPRAYLLWTSKKMGEPGLKKLKFDYASILAGSLQGKTPEEEEFLINELIKLKKHDKLYQISEGTIQIKPLEDGLLSQAEAVLHLPAKISPGLYTLEITAFKEGESALLRSYPLKVQLTGLPAFLHDLSNRRGLLYGVLAVFIATLGGLGMGIFFSSRGSH